MRRFDIALGLAVLLCGIHAVMGTEVGGASPELLPWSQPSVFNVHSRCAASKKEPCTLCHPKAPGSRWSSERLVPDMDLCSSCHAATRDVTISTPVTKECRSCHSSLKDGERPLRGVYPRPNIRFSHKAHNVECGVCHLRAASSLVRQSEPDVPNMKKCFDCHDEGKGRTECRKCHLVDKGGLMITEFGGKRLLPPDWLNGPTHGVEWVGRHAQAAGANSSYCGSCHLESFCRDCHTGKLRPRNVHPSDWMALHGTGIRLDSPRCQGCHRKQSFCLGCHRRAGVAPDSPAGSRPIGGMGRYHGDMSNKELMRRARRNITSCVSCHSENSCITCHATRNPHPPGFRRKCKPLAARNHRACSKCHSDEAWKRCI